MDSAAVKTDLINTLNVIGGGSPILIEEICSYFVGSQQVDNKTILSVLQELQQEKKVFINEEGFVSFSEIASSDIKKRLDLEESTREKSKYAKGVLSFLNKIGYIRFVGAIGDSSFGRISADQKIKLIIIVEKDTKHLAKFVLEKYLGFKFARKNFTIEKIFEIGDLKWANADAENGVKLLNLITFVNKNKTYESFMSANNWIFEIFSNYPLEKVSWGFRVSKNIGNEVWGFYKSLNKFLRPKD